MIYCQKEHKELGKKNHFETRSTIQTHLQLSMSELCFYVFWIPVITIRRGGNLLRFLISFSFIKKANLLLINFVLCLMLQ